MQGTMLGARRRGRPRTAWVDNIKTWTLRESQSYWLFHGESCPRRNGESMSSDRGRLKNRTEQNTYFVWLRCCRRHRPQYLLSDSKYQRPRTCRPSVVRISHCHQGRSQRGDRMSRSSRRSPKFSLLINRQARANYNRVNISVLCLSSKFSGWPPKKLHISICLMLNWYSFVKFQPKFIIFSRITPE